MRPPKPIYERFLEKIVFIPFHECWEWDGYIEHTGYGTFRWKEKKVKAHRAAYLLLKGEIPEDVLVLHKCDNPSCVNPDHLFLGTFLDNNLDCNRKGRRNQWCKLNEDKKEKVKVLRSKGWTLEKIAKRFNVSRSLIGNICGPDMKEMKDA